MILPYSITYWGLKMKTKQLIFLKYFFTQPYLGECIERHQSKVAIGESVSIGGVQPCDVKRQLESGPKVAHSVLVGGRQTDQWFGRSVQVFGAERQRQMNDRHKVKHVRVDEVHRCRVPLWHLVRHQPVGHKALR